MDHSEIGLRQKKGLDRDQLLRRGVILKKMQLPQKLLLQVLLPQQDLTIGLGKTTRQPGGWANAIATTGFRQTTPAMPPRLWRTRMWLSDKEQALLENSNAGVTIGLESSGPLLNGSNISVANEVHSGLTVAIQTRSRLREIAHSSRIITLYNSLQEFSRTLLRLIRRHSLR